MKCKGLNRACVLAAGHKGKCVRLTAATNKEYLRLTKVVTDAIKRGAINRWTEEAAHKVGARGVGTDGLVGPENGDWKHDSGVVEASSGKTANRRTKEAYNAYMREYMKRRRAGLIGIAYG